MSFDQKFIGFIKTWHIKIEGLSHSMLNHSRLPVAVMHVGGMASCNVIPSDFIWLSEIVSLILYPSQGLWHLRLEWLIFSLVIWLRRRINARNISQISTKVVKGFDIKNITRKSHFDSFLCFDFHGSHTFYGMNVGISFDDTLSEIDDKFRWKFFINFQWHPETCSI